jgi:2-oxoglutarate-Fe(II)-dependent oxygenase superfamily protein
VPGEPPSSDNSIQRLMRALSLRMILDPVVLQPDNWSRIQGALRELKLVVIRDAIKTTYAERVHASLCQCPHWAPYEGANDDFHFRHHNLYVKGVYPPEISECQAFFSAEDTKSLIGELSGRDCSAETSFSASWYMPLDYSLPHDDCTSGPPPRRQVAFLWHLTKDWDPRWGGHLYWGPSQQLVAPSFNTLMLFAIYPHSRHFVAPVAPNAVGKRLAISGWWQGETSYSSPVRHRRTGDRVQVL